jgi:hypothetical protein
MLSEEVHAHFPPREKGSITIVAKEECSDQTQPIPLKTKDTQT